MKKATIAFVFAALSVGTMGCNKSKADTATPEEGTKTETPPPADAAPPADGETPPAEGEGDKAAPEGEAPPAE
jgi:hypothetical protein